jgi:hypothetical protein
VPEKKGKLKYCICRVHMRRMFALKIISMSEMSKGKDKDVPMRN